MGEGSCLSFYLVFDIFWKATITTTFKK